MKEFVKRIGITLKNILIYTGIAIVIIIAMMLISFLVSFVPMLLLETVIGDFAVLWAVFLFLIIVVDDSKDEIKKWFKWQFIEPFKKDK